MTTARPVRQWNGLTVPDAGTYALDEAHKRIGFTGMHMMVSPVRGEFTRASATILVGEDPLASAVSATIETASLTTHHEERDAIGSSPTRIVALARVNSPRTGDTIMCIPVNPMRLCASSRA